MFSFTQKILKTIFFKVKVNEILSDTKVKKEGTPQGAVISPRFFILKINKVIAQLPNYYKFQTSLYIDDLQITYRHPNCNIIERKLQDCINVVGKFAQKNGIKLSTSKTSMLHFTKLSIPPPKELRPGKIRIQISDILNTLA